mgnify:CR=1 FL=1
MGTHPFEFVTVTPQNVDTESLCCIVRKKAHPGVEAKRAWLRDRLPEGHIFRKIPGDGCAFIEYAPLSTAWVPILGDRYLYIYCLWVDGAMKKHGYGSALMESCIHDAKEAGWAGICCLGATNRRHGWRISPSLPILAFALLRKHRVGIVYSRALWMAPCPGSRKMPCK